jgi:uncharacterized protein Veg
VIEKIKSELCSNIGKRAKVVFNSGRNRTEEFEATITEAYEYIFVVKLDNENGELKTFTYSDILTKTVEIYYK